MTEFSGSTPIGGIYVTVDLDDSKYIKKRDALKAQLARDEKQMVMRIGGAGGMGAPTAQQRFAMSWGLGGEAGGGGGPAMSSGGGWTMPGPSPRNQPRARSSREEGGYWNSPLGVTMGGGHSLLSVYGIAKTAEAFMQLGTSAIQTTRAMGVARNNVERAEAMIGGRESMERGLEQIPVFGPLAASGRRFVDAIRGQSPDDIRREFTLAQQQEDFDTSILRGRAGNAELRAKVRAGSFLGGGSIEAEKASLDSHRDTIFADRAAAKQAIGNKYQNTDAESQYDALDKFASVVTLGTAQQPDAENRALQINKDMQLQRQKLSKIVDDRTKLEQDEIDNLKKKIDFDTAQLRFSMQNRTDVADLTIRRKFNEAETTRRFGEYKLALAQQPLELRDSFKKMSFRELQAERESMLTDIGRHEAGAVDYTHTVIGDPSGIRKLLEPIKSVDDTLWLMRMEPFSSNRLLTGF